METNSNILFQYNDNLYDLFLQRGQKKVLYASNKHWMPDNQYVYMLNQGILKVYVANANGNEKFLYILSKGSMIPNFSNKSTKIIRILTTTTVFALKKDHLIKLFAENPQIFDLFMKQIYNRYEEILSRSVENSSERSINKLCQLLYEVAKISSNNTENVKIKNYLSRQDMAYYVGTHVTNISKLLKQLEFDGLIKRDGREITITDTEKLKNYFAE